MPSLKQYEISNNVLEKLPMEDAANTDFSKYKKNNMATTWCYIKNNTLTYISQLNINNKIYGGLITEPYKLFLSHAKEMSVKTTQTQNSFDNQTHPFELSDSFKINIIKQNMFDVFLLSKISCVVFLIMSVESFINEIIPCNFTLKDKTKADIEKTCCLKTKFKDIVPKIKQIDDVALYQSISSQILNLNNLRSSFIHLKTTNPENKLDPIINDIEKILKLDVGAEYLKVENFIQMVNQCQNFEQKT